jgi:hypothetical protein
MAAYGCARGQTLGLRRDTPYAIGELLGIGNHIADDYQLGESVRRRDRTERDVLSI